MQHEKITLFANTFKHFDPFQMNQNDYFVLISNWKKIFLQCLFFLTNESLMFHEARILVGQYFLWPIFLNVTSSNIFYFRFTLN